MKNLFIAALVVVFSLGCSVEEPAIQPPDQEYVEPPGSYYLPEKPDQNIPNPCFNPDTLNRVDCSLGSPYGVGDPEWQMDDHSDWSEFDKQLWFLMGC